MIKISRRWFLVINDYNYPGDGLEYISMIIYPRDGFWLSMIINIQEMVWNIVNNLDYETAKKVSLEDRVPFLELTGLLEVSEIKGKTRKE